MAARSGRLLTLQILLEHGARVDAVTNTGQTALHIAASHGHLYVLNELFRRLDIDQAQEPDSSLRQDNDGHTPFTLALRSDHINIARALLQRAAGRFPAQELQGEKDALCMAVENGSEDCIPLLFEKGWDCSTGSGPRVTALHLAAEKGHVSMIELLC